jgi:hypothetical protein
VWIQSGIIQCTLLWFWVPVESFSSQGSQNHKEIVGSRICERICDIEVTADHLVTSLMLKTSVRGEVRKLWRCTAKTWCIIMETFLQLDLWSANNVVTSTRQQNRSFQCSFPWRNSNLNNHSCVKYLFQETEKEITAPGWSTEIRGDILKRIG